MLINSLNSVCNKLFFVSTFIFFGSISFGQIVKNPNSAEKKGTISIEQAEKNEKELKQNAESIFPVFVNTGNASLDNENYRLAKEAWILANPLKYENMISTTPKTVFSRSEFMTFSEEKRTEILAHPEKFIVE
jgi:hypothetical protein